MRYLVRAKVKPCVDRALLRAIDHGALGRGEPFIDRLRREVTASD